MAAVLAMLPGCAMLERPPSTRAVIGHTVAATVQVSTVRPDTVRRSGSAVVIGPAPDRARTLILTTNHLLAPAVDQAISVGTAPDGPTLPAKLLAIDEATDLALLEVAQLPAQPAAIRPHAQLGDPVWVVSFPWGRERTVVSGVVSQVAPQPTSPVEGPVRLIDAAVSYGMSGGGVFDGRTGALVGLVRGYRTAQLALPEDGSKPVNIPVAAETTVISGPEMVCFLARAGVRPLVAAAGQPAPDCPEPAKESLQ
jgi:S1-C subfamily serine protease